MLTRHKPDKIHLSIHHPQSEEEVERVLSQTRRLAAIDIKPGVNLLVGADTVETAGRVFARLCGQLQRDQIILIPQRFANTPTSGQLASVANGAPFQSPSCLLACSRPTGFCSVSWDKRVNSCSFAPGKVPLPSLDYQGLQTALTQVCWRSCS